MLSAGAWRLGQQNLITFVLVDSNGVEVTGLGSGYTLQLSKAGGAFASSTGTKAEIGGGWYKYLSTADESDTVGPVAIRVTHASTLQQNLEYVVEQRTINAVEYTYTVTSSVSGLPIQGVEVWFTLDDDGAQVVWYGVTDAAGVARDEAGNLPRLDAGSYYVHRQKSGFVFNDPDVEVVS